MTSETEFDPEDRSDAENGTAGQGSSAPSDPLIGLLVDERYRIQARLARGGMATVYVAHDEQNLLISLRVLGARPVQPRESFRRESFRFLIRE